MTVEKSDRKAGVPPVARRATDGDSRRIAKSSAVLRCLVLVSTCRTSGSQLLADMAFNLIEKAIDRLESYREISQSSREKTNGDPS